jgi:uncharacterized protein (DUF433 family)
MTGSSPKEIEPMASLDWSQCPAVESIPGKVGGAWVFRGTSLPVATVIENLEDLSIDKVIEQFDVTREQVTAVLEFVAQSPRAAAGPAGARRSRRRKPRAGTNSAMASCCSRPTVASATNRTCECAASPSSF